MTETRNFGQCLYRASFLHTLTVTVSRDHAAVLSVLCRVRLLPARGLLPQLQQVRLQQLRASETCACSQRTVACSSVRILLRRHHSVCSLIGIASYSAV